ncbi:universal stress protein [Streptomyces amritsarensis]|uniref:universal stress protein n=1 Tax=Streptomyces amritsarensis TaxID=681158 RepID=UPI00367D5F2B
MAAARFALREAATRDCDLHVVRAWRCPHTTPSTTLHSPTAPASTTRHVPTPSSTRSHRAAAGTPAGPATRAPAEGPRAQDPPRTHRGGRLVVVGAHRHEHTRGLHSGRVAHTLLHHPLCPVAVVPKVEGNTRA